MKQRDERLVRKVLSGDLEAFNSLDSSYRKIAQQEAIRLVGDPFEAEDVVQEAMLRAYVKLEQLSDLSRFGSWFASIVRSVSLDHIRRRMKYRERPMDPTELSNFAVRQSAFNAGTQEDEWSSCNELKDALSALSPSLRDVVRLRVQNRLNLAEIADRLHIPLGTVKRRLHDAKRKIRRLSMKRLDERAAWEIVNTAGRDIENLPDDVKQDIIGVAIGGDLARGDFIPNNSNLLVFPLLSNRLSLYIYDTPAYKAITKIFDKLCKPYYDCAEGPTVWENMTLDEIHLPKTAESFDPPTVPQPHWYSMYLFDLIEHHHIVYCEDFIKDLYRPDPRNLTIRMASETLRIVRTRAAGPTKPPAGFETLIHWQVLKMIKILQLHFSPDAPTIAREEVLTNYKKSVPEFPSKSFGEKLWKQDIEARYPADRKDYSDQHAARCKAFVEDSCQLLLNQFLVIKA